METTHCQFGGIDYIGFSIILLIFTLQQRIQDQQTIIDQLNQNIDQLQLEIAEMSGNSSNMVGKFPTLEEVKQNFTHFGEQRVVDFLFKFDNLEVQLLVEITTKLQTFLAGNAPPTCINLPLNTPNQVKSFSLIFRTTTNTSLSFLMLKCPNLSQHNYRISLDSLNLLAGTCGGFITSSCKSNSPLDLNWAH